MSRSLGYTETQLAMVRSYILDATADVPIAGKTLDAKCNTTPHTRSEIVKELRKQGDPVIGRDWRHPCGYFWGQTAHDCREQAQISDGKAQSYAANARRFDEHAVRIELQELEDKQAARFRDGPRTELAFSPARDASRWATGGPDKA